MTGTREKLFAGAATFVVAAFLSAPPALAGKQATQTNLVSDGFITTPVTDPNLVNPWGIAFGPGGAFWISDNGTGLTTLYSGTGAIENLVVTIPLPPGGSGHSAPTGQVFNATSDFVIKEGAKSAAPPFIFAAEDGTITGWSPSVDVNNAVIAVDNSASGAVYKGIAIYAGKSGNTLLVTNFFSGFVELYDANYKKIGQFRDEGDGDEKPLPKNYAPYNVQVFGNHIFVTYAKQDKQKHDSISAPGAGFVDEVSITGHLIRRVAEHEGLNAPWGLAIAPAGFGNLAGALLVGNFGDGTVSAYRVADHKYLGQLRSAAGGKLKIDGLWGLAAGGDAQGADPTKVYFTAGPQEETHGLFGSLSLPK